MARKKTKNRVYIAEVSPGEYRRFTQWPECEAFVKGRNIKYAGGANEPEALAKLLKSKSKSPSKPKKPAPDVPTLGICSDAGTKGNPGPAEYQVADLQGTVLEHKFLGVHSNNFAELAGIGAMIQYAIRHGHTTLWTDSQIAIGWIESGLVGPTVRERELILRMVTKIQGLLRENPDLKLKKWHTRRWGEIPADFGRKG